jgi:hypothetical protein
MGVRKLAMVILVYGCATGCGGSTTPAGPSSVPSPTDVTIALTGSVRDATDNAVVSDVMVQIANGPDIEKFTTTDGTGNFALTGLKVGAFVVRFSRSGFENLDRTVSASQDTRLDVQLRRGPACPPLPAPTGMRVQVSGSTVTYEWNAVAGADDYLLGVGTSSGSSRTRSTNTTQLNYVWRGMSAGTYYARVVARNACVRSNASNEVLFTVGS